MAHLVFQTAFPGDLFLSIPLLKRIREWDPSTPIVLACRPGLGEFFKESGLVDEVIAINKRDKKQSAETRALLRKKSWDVVFVPHESVRTALWLAGVRARHKVGFARWWNVFFYDKRVVKPMDYPDALRQLSLLTSMDDRLAEWFGGEDVQELRNLKSRQGPVDYRVPVIPEWASMRIMTPQPEGKVVFMAPGSTWNTKRWTARGYIELAVMLLGRGYSVELVGSPAERDLCEQILSGAKSRVVDGGIGNGNIVNRAGETSLWGLVKRLRIGRALITNDSGSMHAAAVSGLPTVAVFGPTTLDLGFRPWQNHAVVVQKDLDCRPCGKHGHQKCPLGHHNCMEKIEAAEVMSAFLKVVGS